MRMGIGISPVLSVLGRVNQQVQYYKKNLKNSSLGEEMFNFSLGRRFILFCPDLLRPEAATLPVPFHCTAARMLLRTFSGLILEAASAALQVSGKNSAMAVAVDKMFEQEEAKD